MSQNKTSNKIPWTLTRYGIAFNNACLIAAASGSLLAYLLVHGYCLDKYKEVVQMYRDGEEKPLNPEVQKRAEEVLNKCADLDRHKNVKFFTVHGCNLFHAGSVYLKWGGIVGIPTNFAYKTATNVEKRLLQVNNCSSTDWSSEDGQKLLNSLVLSEKAQKFAIAQQIYQCYTYQVVFQGLIASASIFVTYLLSYRINRYLNLLQRSRKLRMILYSLCSALGWTTFITFSDGLTLYYEKVSDAKASSLDSEYLEGGIEYYEKCLSRNCALRSLMGEKGKKLYTALGNDEVFIRVRNLPYTTRLDSLKKKLEEVKQS